MNRYIIGIVVCIGSLFVGCGNQQEYFKHDIQEAMAVRRVINDTSGQQVFSVIEKQPRPRKQLSYSWYRNRAVSTTKGNYSGLLIDGTYEKFDLKNNLRIKGSFKKGIPQGRWQYWFENGNLNSVQEYDDRGRLHGPYESYSITKQRLDKGGYRHGKKRGVWIEKLDTVRYKRGVVFVKDTTRAPFTKRILQKFKKKDTIEQENVKKSKRQSKKNAQQGEEPNFFKRLFKKKNKPTT